MLISLGRDFSGPCAQAHGQGRHVHTDTAPIVKCMRLCLSTKTIVIHPVRTTTTTTRLNQVCDPFVKRSCEMMAESSVGPSAGVAMRRRERRLCSWWRGRWRSKFRTSACGRRRLLQQRSGRASLRSPGRSGATAACGAPQETACRPSPCRLWQGRQERRWTPPLSPSSLGLSWRGGSQGP